MPRKRLGKGAVIKLDSTAIGCVRKFTPPERTREETETTCLDDNIEEFLDSDPPNEGMLKLTVVYEPGDANSQLIDDLFGGATPDDREGNFEIDWNMYSPVPTDAFSGRVLKITPSEVETKTLIARDIEIRLTTPITRTIAS